MASIFDAMGALIIWLCLFQTDLLRNISSIPLSAILNTLTLVDAFLFLLCFIGFSIFSRSVEKFVFSRKKEVP